jgi:hypothetical protein
MAFQNINKQVILGAIKDRNEKQKMTTILNISDSAVWRMEDANPSWPNLGGRNKVKQHVIATSKDIVDAIKKEYKKATLKSFVLETKINAIKIQIGIQPVLFRVTGKLTDSSGKTIPESTMTRMQELGSAWIFKRAIQDNITWNTWEDIKTDKVTMKEMNRIWKTIGDIDTVGDDWIQNFWKQNKTLITKVGSTKFTEFNREGKYTLPGQKQSDTFMDWVSNLILKKYGISKKDNWNPADIWLIQNEDKWRKLIEDAVDTGKYGGRTVQSIEELNYIFRALYRRKQIFGISLKKISGDTAQWEEVNVGESFFTKLESLAFTYDKGQCKLGVKTLKNGAVTLQTQDTRIFVVDGTKTYNFQIKANSSTSFSNLKYEPTASGAGAARLGKATIELVDDLLKSYGLNFDKTNSKYPKTADEFVKEETEYKKMIEYLYKQNVDLGFDAGSETVETAFNNLLFIFSSEPHVANSKLIQITWLYNFLTLNKKNRNKFGTDLVFLAMKAGRRYGPFGKLY